MKRTALDNAIDMIVHRAHPDAKPLAKAYVSSVRSWLLVFKMAKSHAAAYVKWYARRQGSAVDRSAEGFSYANSNMELYEQKIRALFPGHDILFDRDGVFISGMPGDHAGRGMRL